MFPKLLLNEPSQLSIKMITESTAIPRAPETTRPTMLPPFLARSFQTSINEEPLSSKRARSTVRTKDFRLTSKKAFGRSPARHKHLRDPSPVERTIPRDFSVKRNVAYLFEKEQPKFGDYLSPQARASSERLMGMQSATVTAIMKRINHVYK